MSFHTVGAKFEDGTNLFLVVEFVERFFADCKEQKKEKK